MARSHDGRGAEASIHGRASTEESSMDGTPTTETQNEPNRRQTLRPEGMQDFTFERFREQYETHRQELFESIQEALQHWDQVLEENRKLQERNQRLQQEHEVYERQVDLLIQERDELKDKIVEMTLSMPRTLAREDTPASTQGNKRSTKLPDPPILTDGKDPKFEDWLSRIKDKLLVNEDHYPTDQIQRAYVISRIGGEAAGFIAPRLRSDSHEPYQDLADLFRHLTDIYDDPNRVANAKRTFRKLLMLKNDVFHTFYSTFLRLANEAHIAPELLKDELYDKLSFDLQKQVFRDHQDPTCTFKRFVTTCSTTDHALKEIDSRQNRVKRAMPTAPSTERLSEPKSPPFPRRTPPASTTYTERQKLLQENKCFYCKQEGHRAFECPKKEQPKNRPTEIKAVEVPTEEPESGKDLP